MTIQTPTRVVTTVRPLPSGHVRVSCGRHWAQMPRAVWEALAPGEAIPSAYTFEGAWVTLTKED